METQWRLQQDDRKREGKENLKRRLLKQKVSFNTVSKIFIENYRCLCKRRCHTLFSEDERKNILDEFYKLANYVSQTSFITANITEENIKRKRVKTFLETILY